MRVAPITMALFYFFIWRITCLFGDFECEHVWMEFLDLFNNRLCRYGFLDGFSHPLFTKNH